jgi:beta-lactamase class A
MVKPLIIALLVAGVAFGAGWVFKPVPPGTVIFEDDSTPADFPLINPSATSNLGKHFIINVVPLKDTLREIREKYAHQTYVYFAYLNNDSWVGFDEKELFTAASTIKVPLAMAVMKSVEQKKLSLDQEYILMEEDLDENFGTLYQKGEGTVLTVEELIQVMLEDSDNTAMQALRHILRDIGITDPFADVYAFMGWDSFGGFGEEPVYFDINLKTLSNMFLALYNAKYVNLEHSQKILGYLDNENFNEEIAPGIPSSIPFAHKTGVQEAEQIYSDCGIVYAPNRNYLLCIGSKGASKSVADKFMTEASRAVYDYVIQN